MELLIVLSILLFLGLTTVSILFYFKVKFFKDSNTNISREFELAKKALEQRDEIVKQVAESLTQKDIEIRELEQKRVNDLADQEEELVETIDVLTDEIENLQDKNNSLVSIIDRIWNNAVTINNFYVKVLERGFLHDNYQVKQLNEQMVNFIKDIEKIKSLNESLFQEITEEEEE